MSNRAGLIAGLVLCCLSYSAHSESADVTPGTFKALKCPPPVPAGTWAILDRDGANRAVEPYLSSLGGGEAGTGAIASPPFTVAADTIAFTICGHDGQGGGRNENFVALVDAQTGEILRKTMAPGADPMQERAWDVADLRGRKVRIEVHDGNSAGAYAWLGIGRIDAGAPLNVDFRKGLPDGWKAEAKPVDERTELVEDGIPFRRRAAAYTLIPESGALDIPCGFRAARLYFLGGTIARGEPLTTYGYIEIVYRGGFLERYPLLYGYTLDGQGKLLSPSKALHLHRSGDPFQPYLVIAPRAEVIETIHLERNPAQPWVARITAITCETTAESENLEPLPPPRLTVEEKAWIESHAISATSPDLDAVARSILRAHLR